VTSEPTTAAGRALLDAIRPAVLDPEMAVLLSPDAHQQLVALVSIALLEREIPAIEAEARAEAIRDYQWPSPSFVETHNDALAAEKARVARLLELVRELAETCHQTGSIRDHADPTDRTGWNVHSIETCDDSLCVDALQALAETADTEPTP
jgi:hypothetical protein